MNPYNPQAQERTARQILAKRIRMLRAMRCWSQEVLAELAGLHRTYVGALERAEQNPCLGNIEKIANAFEVPVRSLLDERFENLFNQEVNRVKESRAIYGNGVFGNVIPLAVSEKRLGADLAA